MNFKTKKAFVFALLTANPALTALQLVEMAGVKKNTADAYRSYFGRGVAY